ncbi:TIGR02234 family membrane protein [Corynebacterium felinum]|uniref:Membrane protein (TIGR02234 family) n=1 Tax=Corynebacterium felinum TaxID=131318 RepID=A0ABU2BCK0_9CORY|nr:TIGR02234 family membrane protein [Corynebacterium felinum]MDF5819541.1 TIGR02234 family membrane protein [Corynebacterium felinum]MDR7356076.1 putative membrane protein (TIGR02234 family) [Corynebacterium felinum]WJY95410.1 Tryptophan-associated transmembrane protein [Corynebacterium felinum]
MKKSVAASLSIGAAALILWATSRMTWINVEAFDDKSGAKSLTLLGAQWASETVILSFVLGAACLAGLSLKTLGRRIVGVITTLVCVLASYSILQHLITTPDAARALNILSAPSANTAQPTQLATWAEITAISSNPLPASIALIAMAVGIVSGVVLALKPGVAKTSSAYERKSQREQRIVHDLDTDPDSGRVQWDALDADIDPTDRE